MGVNMADRKQVVSQKPSKEKGKKIVWPMSRLRRMKKNQQSAVVSKVSNEFIQDLSEFMKKLSNKPDLLKKTSYKKTLKRHSEELQKLIRPKTPIRQQTEKETLSYVNSLAHHGEQDQ